MVWYAQVPVHGTYTGDLLPGYLLVGFGLALSFIPVSIAALAGVQQQEAGLASGLINTSQQIGGAIGVAVASTIAATHTRSFHRGPFDPTALTAGYRWGFWLLAGIAALAVAATLAFVRPQELREIPAQALPAPN